MLSKYKYSSTVVSSYDSCNMTGALSFNVQDNSLRITRSWRYTERFKSLGIDKCPYEIPRTMTDDSVAPQNGVDNMGARRHGQGRTCPSPEKL